MGHIMIYYIEYLIVYILQMKTVMIIFYLSVKYVYVRNILMKCHHLLQTLTLDGNTCLRLVLIILIK